MGRFICDYDKPVVATTSGKIRGYFMDDVYYFKGVPYAEAERFMPPHPVRPWEGILNCTAYGHVCPPSVPVARTDNDFIYGMTSWPSSENCQNLNIWTTALESGKKLPVMFYIHGGALSWGSSIELKSYEATGLCKKGDVVVVTINHRLNLLGFMNLSAYGEKYRNSATVGLADIEAALDWVRDNIAEFGGDPENITIFGHSGGGMKVQSMMQIPSAVGKFQKAIVMSGITYPYFDITNEQTAEVTDAILAELGIGAENIDQLEKLPVQEILNAFYRVSESVLPGRNASMIWKPVPNSYYRGYPLETGFLPENSSVPVMAGTAISEFGDKYLYTYSDSTDPETKEKLLRDKFGERTVEVVDEFRKAYPDKDLIDLFLLDDVFRKPTIDFLDERVKMADAPVYSYMFAYNFNLFGGFPAWHNSELSVMFGSYDALPPFHDDDIPPLSDAMIAAWSSFARTGSPNNDLLPEWRPYKTGDEVTMILDRRFDTRVDYDRKLMDLTWPK